MRHMDIYGPRLPIKIEAPGFLQDLFPAEDKAAVLCKGQEKVKFLGTQAERLGGEPDFISGRVDRQIAEMDGCRAIHVPGTFAAAQDRSDAGYQFTRIEWLGQVIIRTEFETQDLINIFVAGSEHQDRCRVL